MTAIAAMHLADGGRQLLADAAAAPTGRATRLLLSMPGLRCLLIALSSGQSLAEHDSPPAATLFVQSGTVRLTSGREGWTVHAGQLIAIPPARHALHADTDAVVLLTVRLDERAAEGSPAGSGGGPG